MSEHLVLRLHPEQPDRASWVIADSSGERASMTETGTIADAARRAQQRPVMVLVPGQEVLLAKVNLPVRGTSKMLQAVPFALEEQLADDVSKMHFALGKRDANNLVTAAAVSESLMEMWLSQLDEAGLEISHVLPDTIGIPVHDGVCILIDGTHCFIRDASGKILVGDTDSAAAFVSAMGFDGQTQVADVYVTEADATTYSQVLSEIRMALPDISVNEMRNGALPVMAATALRVGQPNLLQGAYARSSGNEKLWRPWRTAAMLGGVFILVALSAKALEVMSLKSELRALNSEMNQIASDVMPDSRIVDPLLQLEQLATNLRGGSQGGNTDFLDMLNSLSLALTSASNTTMGKLDYRNGTMDLTLTAPDVDTLDKISREIASQGLSAEIQSANQRDDAVQGRLRISEQDT
ncbi:MAG: type II secretion system protein GspL [Gammaproteobacteria bacterium]|nr:type II secretion system protein GspL [Gammaproteobacteria bacterium]MDH3768722.1 type II secretion system protein GspL [Gammaproteobacteria bacterium]